MGEWISTPPDACDPCCGDQWVGGATACRPFLLAARRIAALDCNCTDNVVAKRRCCGCEHAVAVILVATRAIVNTVATKK